MRIIRKKCFVFLAVLISTFTSSIMALNSGEKKAIFLEKLKEETKQLKINGTITRYHDLLVQPYNIGLQHDGFIVGIEKSPKDLIFYPEDLEGEFDNRRFRKWQASDDLVGKEHLSARNQQFENILDDPKAMFVSHIIGYEQKEDRPGSHIPSLLYSSYKNHGFSSHDENLFSNDRKLNCKITAPKGQHYERGWQALDCLKEKIDAKLGEKPGHYTHIVVASMGWNNDQLESVARYNALIGNTRAEAAKQDEIVFNPLFVGITWPSVWFGKSFFNSINKIGHIGSYLNKANDADDIGYTIGNYLLNSIIPSLRQKHKFQTVIIGHSLGARVLSRALLSGHLLKQKVDVPFSVKEDSIFIGLQPAFSVRRFKENNKNIALVRPFHKGEGAPYVLFRKVNTKIILTTSDDDKANPFARLLTQAAHVGGKNGRKEAEKNISHNINTKKFKTASIEGVICQKMRKSEKLLLVDATNFIAHHNDIQGTAMGEFLWSVISCFQK